MQHVSVHKREATLELLQYNVAFQTILYLTLHLLCSLNPLFIIFHCIYSSGSVMTRYFCPPYSLNILIQLLHSEIFYFFFSWIAITLRFISYLRAMKFAKLWQIYICFLSLLPATLPAPDSGVKRRISIEQKVKVFQKCV